MGRNLSNYYGAPSTRFNGHFPLFPLSFRRLQLVDVVYDGHDASAIKTLLKIAACLPSKQTQKFCHRQPKVFISNSKRARRAMNAIEFTSLDSD